MGPFFKTIDLGLMGRKTYEAGVRMNGGKFDSHGLRCYIFSRSLPEGERDGAIFVREEPKRFVEELRKKKGKDIWLIGGGELMREFLKEDLVDELYLGIVPVLVGEGIPLFAAGFPQREFTLTESRTYSGGVIALKYERVRGKAAVEAKSTSKSKRKR
jgi:dihydrofolate reductase